MSVYFYSSGVLRADTHAGKGLWGDDTTSTRRHLALRTGPSLPRQHNLIDRNTYTSTPRRECFTIRSLSNLGVLLVSVSNSMTSHLHPQIIMMANTFARITNRIPPEHANAPLSTTPSRQVSSNYQARYPFNLSGIPPTPRHGGVFSH